MRHLLVLFVKPLAYHNIMKNLEDIKQLLSEAGFKDFEGSNIERLINNYKPSNTLFSEDGYFFNDLYLSLYEAINIGRKEIIDSI